jgi:hypothetical protein
MGLITVSDGTSDPILTRMVEEDNVPWYRKPNLRVLYLYLFICCIGIEITSGFDSQLINVMQYSEPFKKCNYSTDFFFLVLPSLIPPLKKKGKTKESFQSLDVSDVDTDIKAIQILARATRIKKALPSSLSF